MKRTLRMVDGQLVWDPPFTAADEARHQRNFREMVAAGQGPALLTDAVFLQGHVNGSQFEHQEHIGNYYAHQARQAGVDPKGKVYLSSLAAYPGDPRAWVDGRGDVQRVCEERGWQCDGSVQVKGVKAEPLDVPIAEDIVQREMALAQAGDPGLAEKSAEEVREKVVAKITPHWKKKRS